MRHGIFGRARAAWTLRGGPWRAARRPATAAWLAPVMALLACSEPALSSELVPGTRVTLEELFFLPGEDRIYRFESPTRLCLTDKRRREYRGGGIAMISGENPFSALDTLPATCPVSIIGPRDPSRLRDARTVRTPACEIGFKLRGSRLESAEARVLDDSGESFRECVYRTALFVEGYNGAAAVERQRLFIDANRTLFLDDRSIVGESIPFVVHQLRLLCRGVSPTNDLSRADLRHPSLCRKEF